MTAQRDWQALRRVAVGVARDAGLSRSEAEDVAHDALVVLLVPRTLEHDEAYLRRVTQRLAVRVLRGRLIAVDPEQLEALLEAEFPAESERTRIADDVGELVRVAGVAVDDERLWSRTGAARAWRHRLRRTLGGPEAPHPLKGEGGTAGSGAPTRRSISRNFFSGGERRA